MFFFFQAEDGIRDFCLSRGLGDVYKRQDYGYHILQYTSEGGGEVPFDDVKDSIISTKLNEAQTAYQEETIKKWQDEENIKTYPDRLSTFA